MAGLEGGTGEEAVVADPGTSPKACRRFGQEPAKRVTYPEGVKGLAERPNQKPLGGMCQSPWRMNL